MTCLGATCNRWRCAGPTSWPPSITTGFCLVCRVALGFAAQSTSFCSGTYKPLTTCLWLPRLIAQKRRRAGPWSRARGHWPRTDMLHGNGMDAHVRPRLVYMRQCVRARSCRVTYALERMHGRIGRLVRASQKAKDDSLCGARTSCQGHARAPTRAPYRWPVGARSVQTTGTVCAPRSCSCRQKSTCMDCHVL